MDKPDYKKIANDARIRVLEMIYKAQTSHIGSNYSCVDLLAVIFEKINLDCDKFILSKGWAAASLYYFLKEKGRITEADLDSFCQPGSKFIGLAEPVIPDIPAAGGSMGFGLPFGVGFAMAKKVKKDSGKIFTLMSDGEMQIGTTWESALIAAHHKLDNLLVFVDCNGLQAMGGVNDILNIEPLAEKWKAFGWNVCEINGHDFGQIEKVINGQILEKPTVVIAETIKGKGVSFMEGQNLYHYKAPSEQEYQTALDELKTNG
jgi:transketolase